MSKCQRSRPANVLSLKQQKQAGKRISMVTCYDAWSAKILNESPVDCILVGDSLAVVMHGFESTVHATVEMMTLHTAAVARGAPDKFIVADMPFLTCSRGIDAAMDAVQSLMQAGANAVKIEGADHQLPIIKRIVEAGVPVMGHLGLTPQSVTQLGGFRVQATEVESAQQLVSDAKSLEAAGAFSIVLECVPEEVAQIVTDCVSIPTIGIGAGRRCDAQVLVFHDLIGISSGYSPRFVRAYASVEQEMLSAVKRFSEEVREGQFPGDGESFHLPAEKIKEVRRRVDRLIVDNDSDQGAQ